MILTRLYSLHSLKWALKNERKLILLPKNSKKITKPFKSYSSTKTTFFADKPGINPLNQPRRSVAAATPVMTMEKPIEKSLEKKTELSTFKPVKLFPQKYLEPKKEENEIAEINTETNTPIYTGLEGVLGHKVLVVRRKMEWGTVILGYQQANKYELVNEEGHTVGYMAEEDSILNTVGRQMLKNHRSFKVTIFDGAGNQVLQVDRPVYLVSSSLFINNATSGERIGEVHMDWHLLKRRYKLLHKEKPFAYVDAGFLGVEFDMKNQEGKSISRVSLDWTTLPKLLFTDANAYSLRFDPEEGAPAMELEERAITLALAVSVDHDYFSRHGGGPSFPFFPMFWPSSPAPASAPATEGDNPEGVPPESSPVASEPSVQGEKPWNIDNEPTMGDNATTQQTTPHWGQSENEGGDSSSNDDGGNEGGEGGNWWEDIFSDD